VCRILAAPHFRHEADHYIWNEIPVLVTFESDWRRAKGLLEEIAVRHALHLSEEEEEAAAIRAAARRFMIFYTKLSPTVYTSVADSGVMARATRTADSGPQPPASPDGGRP
jgi:hypothetical protein